MEKIKILGSKLGSNEEVTHRIKLGNAAFSDYKKMWINNKHIGQTTKIKLYKSVIVPIMMYNAST